LDATIQPIVAALRQRALERRLALRVEFWNGHREVIGDSPNVTLQLNRPEAALRLLRPDLASLGEAYIKGEIDLHGAASDAVQLAVEFARGLAAPARRWSWRWGRHRRDGDARAIAHHYDVSNDFYGLWLDRERVYSCAYFHDGDETLDSAQQKKLDLICRKLQLQPGERLLDIGCGWGALLRWAARYYGVSGVGITLSRDQHAYARQRMQEEGLAGRIEVRLQDYRDLPQDEHFDKIASVGMFEHVGIGNLPLYFATVARVLRPGGLALNHGITSRSTADDAVRAGGGEFIDRYVFPDGELPMLSQAVGEMEAQGLEVFDVEGLRPHYAKTLQHWVARLEHRRDEAVALVGEERYRTWRIYMAGSAHAFRHGWISVHQILATRLAPGDGWPQRWNRDHLLTPT
jgi:cyclopropane-fatty-acyl-phospholipid synthase